MSFHILKKEVEHILSRSDKQLNERLTNICELLQSEIDHYDWVGFYFAEHSTKTLHLKAFAGEPTDHTVIPFGKGICGQVAESHKNFVVPDVKSQDNYIACSLNVKAEIVVPLFKDRVNIGQIDIDSHTPDPFTVEDERFLEWINENVAKNI
ncbi:histidine kinase [Pukyongia salina]|uniref:Histidine kinase n=1 Tax=Pukyongia salina TaxID=2094025 RepID=A0A2S0I0E5_9FLAO|nr:GAF domain-containing protein [Pukyongia salina]AVI52365.1 histidine kinase [Pukyongia salina]